MPLFYQTGLSAVMEIAGGAAHEEEISPCPELFAGQALPLGKARSAGPEPMNFLEAAWTWIADRLMPEPHFLWEAAGWGMDPNGSDSDDPDGSNNSDEGWAMDPDG